MIKANKVAWFWVLIVLLVACESTPKSLAPMEYNNWITSSKRKFNKVRVVNNVEVQVRYLPAEYLAYKEFISSASESFDSVLNNYKCGLTFQISLESDKSDRTYSNLLRYQISNEQEFLARMQYLSFSSHEFIWVTHNNTRYEPVLSHFEGMDPNGNKINFRVVFDIPEYSCGIPENGFGNIVLTYDDPFLGLGKINTEFDKKNLIEIPDLNI